MQVNKGDTTGNGYYSFTGLEDGTYKIKAARCKDGGRRRIVRITSSREINNVNFECKTRRRIR